jgi:N-methylhydantoinase B
VAFKFLTTPLLLPINEGSFRPLKIILPPGRVVSATKPAPVRTWMTVPMTVADTIFKALASACPDNLMAEQNADVAAPRTFSLQPKTAALFHRCFGGGWARRVIGTGRRLLHQRRRHHACREAKRARRCCAHRSSGRIPEARKIQCGLGVTEGAYFRQEVLSAMERSLCAPDYGSKDAREPFQRRSQTAGRKL